jgi:hypothetical protein
LAWFGIVTMMTSLLLEVPSSYVSDRRWHKKVLVVSKIVKLVSTCLFVMWWDVWIFGLASFLGALWFTLASGTDTAFMLDSLQSLWLDNTQASKKISHIKSYHSFFSMPLIALVWILYSIDPVVLFVTWLGFDILWLIAVLTLKNPSTGDHHHVIKHTQLPSWSLFQKTLFLTIIPSIVYMLISRDGSYKSVFLESLWLPIVLITWTSILSQWMRGLLSRYIQPLLVSYDVKEFFMYEVIWYFLICCALVIIDHPYVIMIILAMMQWRYRSRREMRDLWMIQESHQPKLKATVLSLSSQINSMTAILWLWFVPMMVGGMYAWWYLVIGIVIVCVASVWWLVQYIVVQK